jgi:ZIP family zinc transporter
MRGALIGGMAALATALGTLPVLLSHQFSQRT